MKDSSSKYFINNRFNYKDPLHTHIIILAILCLSFGFYQGQTRVLLPLTVLHYLTSWPHGHGSFLDFAFFWRAHNIWPTVLRSLVHTNIRWKVKRILRNYWKYSKALNLNLCSKFNSVLSRLFILTAFYTEKQPKQGIFYND